MPAPLQLPRQQCAPMRENNIKELQQFVTTEVLKQCRYHGFYYAIVAIINSRLTSFFTNCMVS